MVELEHCGGVGTGPAKGLRLPFGFVRRVVTEPEIRAAQERFIRGTTTDDDRKLIDAALSYLAQKA